MLNFQTLMVTQFSTNTSMKLLRTYSLVFSYYIGQGFNHIESIYDLESIYSLSQSMIF